MTDDRRALLEALAFGDDPRVTPADRAHAANEALTELDASALLRLGVFGQAADGQRWGKVNVRLERGMAPGVFRWIEGRIGAKDGSAYVVAYRSACAAREFRPTLRRPETGS